LLIVAATLQGGEPSQWFEASPSGNFSMHTAAFAAASDLGLGVAASGLESSSQTPNHPFTTFASGCCGSVMLAAHFDFPWSLPSAAFDGESQRDAANAIRASSACPRAS
jgi:hypothetical protein